MGYLVVRCPSSVAPKCMFHRSLDKHVIVPEISQCLTGTRAVRHSTTSHERCHSHWVFHSLMVVVISKSVLSMGWIYGTQRGVSGQKPNAKVREIARWRKCF